MQLLNYLIKGAIKPVAITSEAPMPAPRSLHNPMRAYANYRRLQLETALAGNFRGSAQYARLARSVDVSQNPRAHHWEKAG